MVFLIRFEPPSKCDFRLEAMNRLLYTTYKVEMKVSLFFV